MDGVLLLTENTWHFTGDNVPESPNGNVQNLVWRAIREDGHIEAHKTLSFLHELTFASVSSTVITTDDHPS